MVAADNGCALKIKRYLDNPAAGDPLGSAWVAQRYGVAQSNEVSKRKDARKQKGSVTDQNSINRCQREAALLSMLALHALAVSFTNSDLSEYAERNF